MKMTRYVDVKWLSQVHKGVINEAEMSTSCLFWKQHPSSVREYLLNYFVLIVRLADVNIVKVSDTFSTRSKLTHWEIRPTNMKQ